MCASRLALDSAGRRVVVTTTSDPFTAIGTVFLVLEPRGRPATPREQETARAPYQSTPRWSQPVDVPDEELDEREALEAARREQQREPVDLIGRAA